jgi:DNA repair protein RadD
VICGTVFPTVSKLKQVASTEELIKQSVDPVVEVFKVDHITYSQSFKEGREPIMKVTYYCGLRTFSDYVCLQHEGFASRKARQWWRERSEETPPDRIVDAMEKANQLKVPTQLRVWINKKYPEILGYCYDGTSFGTIAPVAADFPTREADQVQSVPDDFYDDIPF